MNTKPGPVNTCQVAVQRVFIGIPIDKNSQQQINESLKSLENSHRDVSWVPESNRHLTLAFLGNKPGPVVKNLVQLFDETYQQEAYFQYSMSRLTRFPGPKGRIIALVDDPVRRLNNLFQLTLELLRRNNIEFDHKEFRPHITLGRIRRAKHVKTDFDQQMDVNLNIETIVLYQSTLTGSGSVYSILKRTRLN